MAAGIALTAQQGSADTIGLELLGRCRRACRGIRSPLGAAVVEPSSNARGIRPVEPASIVDQVTAEIRRSILDGSLPPGEPFSIVDLCRKLQVSHIPVREALRRLEGHGVLQLRPGRSAVVAPIDADDLRSMYRLRRLIEVDLASRACTLLDDQDIGQLESTLDAYTIEPSNADRVLDEHREFHLGLLRPAASSWDVRVLELLWHAGERYARLALSDSLLEPNAAARQAQAHRALIEAVRSRSPARLRKELRAHLEVNEAMLLKGVERMAPYSDGLRPVAGRA
jgi:DNA-binding GntR family transcriptional regulator